MNHSFNTKSDALDHLYFQCMELKAKLGAIDGMTPFLNLAFNSAEQCGEQQALALSQQMHESAKLSEFRTSMFSMTSDSSNNSNLTNSKRGSGHCKGLVNNNFFTFAGGVLPANMCVDPVTQLWKLFQQGAPFCLIFNAVTSVDYKIPIVGSDDLRVCKKSVYDFIIAVKTYLDFDDEFLFTISNVFSDSTQDLLKIIKVVNKLLKLKDGEVSSSEDLSQLFTDLVISDDRAKVFKEILETERKYVQDLTLLCRYRDDLVEAELVSSEQIHVLFPNLNEIIDFQRRFLIGLECNINVPNKYQRIGSVFIHAASGPFKAYQPWTIGQSNALELINKESVNLKKSSTLLDPGFELQSFILKPIQRLCKYPLLLNELLKNTPESTDQVQSASYNELLVAYNAMKDLATQVNEAQRRSENVECLNKLMGRVNNWRGFTLTDQGELLYHAAVGVKDGEGEKEYVAYLFERIIFFFVDGDSGNKEKDKKSRRDLLPTRKKSSSASNSTTNLLESLNNAKGEVSPLDLKGRVYILEVYNVSSTNLGGYYLIISWTGKKESGTFTLRYRTEELRNQWETCLRKLKANEVNVQFNRKIRDSHNTNDSFEASYSTMSPTTPKATDNVSLRSSNGSSYHRHHSSSSTFSMMKLSRSKYSSGSDHIARQLSNGGTAIFPAESAHSTSGIRINLIYNKIEIREPLLVSTDIQFNELYLKISGKIVNSDEINDDILVNKLKYKDEDGDFVVMDSNDDWTLAVDLLEEMSNGNDNDGNDKYCDLTIWVS